MVDAKLVMTQLEAYCDKLPKQVGAKLDDLAKQTKQPKVYIFGGILAVAAALTLYIIPHSFLFDLVGGLYPAYASLMMISGATYAAEGDLWTTYWVLFFFIRMVTPVLDIFLGMLPFSGLLKLVGLVYLYKGFGGEPGATVVLEKVLKPKVFPLLASSAEAPPTSAKGK